jgi:poly(3-hydroxybutyrate) depolymerase
MFDGSMRGSDYNDGGFGSFSLPVYTFYEATHAALGPARAFSDAARSYFLNPGNPFSYTTWGKSVAAACEVFERVTRRYGKPGFGLESTLVGGERVAVREEVVWQRPFCKLVHFARNVKSQRRADPKILLVAPMSGHYATLLRGTVAAFLPNHEVYVTDWEDARMVPVSAGSFDLDDYIDYVISMLHALGGDTHIIAVCQPSVPVMAAVSRMEAEKDPYSPLTMTLMGGPIDTRHSPTKVNELAVEKGLDWFRRNVIAKVPFPHPGFMRDVYPGFLQLTGFMTMNLDRHVDAHKELYFDLVRGDGDGAQKHREFYDEYLSVMDLTAEFYLQTVDAVFIRHALPQGTMSHRGVPVDPGAIDNVALLTIEGENDDITGHGQTHAAHRLCVNIPEDRKVAYTQPSVGHYGVFNGSRFRAEIAPRIADFIRSNAVKRPRAANVPAPAVAAKAARIAALDEKRSKASRIAAV